MVHTAQPTRSGHARSSVEEGPLYARHPAVPDLREGCSTILVSTRAGQDHPDMAVNSAEVPSLLESMVVEVAHRFAAPIDDVWSLLTDVEQMAGVGPEHTAASWVNDDRGVGAQFDGANKRGDMEWTLPCFVTEWQPPYRFAWAVLERDSPSSTWSYTFLEVDGGTEVVQRFAHGPNYS